MENYKLVSGGRSVERLSDNAFIPFDPANSDYEKFKYDIMDGATLEDADGTAMTEAEATAYIETLP